MRGRNFFRKGKMIVFWLRWFGSFVRIFFRWNCGRWGEGGGYFRSEDGVGVFVRGGELAFVRFELGVFGRRVGLFSFCLWLFCVGVECC